MNHYKIKVIHDNGAFLRKVQAITEQKAKERVCYMLNAPMRAIAECRQITEQQYYNR